MEEDAAKLMHPEGDPGHSLVDFNRSGVPLLEIVSEPDMHSVPQVEAYMTAIRSRLRYLDISHARMEMGEVRFEASISVAPEGAELGTRVEIKNLNSFRAVTGSVAYEIARQTKALESGQPLHQETRLWDPERNATEPMRSKETAMDYRYFPEPDLTPLEIEEAWIAKVKAELPELALAGDVVFRGVRWQILVAPIKQVAYPRLLAYMLVGYLGNNVLPGARPTG